MPGLISRSRRRAAASARARPRPGAGSFARRQAGGSRRGSPAHAGGRRCASPRPATQDRDHAQEPTALGWLALPRFWAGFCHGRRAFGHVPWLGRLAGHGCCPDGDAGPGPGRCPGPAGERRLLAIGGHGDGYRRGGSPPHRRILSRNSALHGWQHHRARRVDGAVCGFAAVTAGRPQPDCNALSTERRDLPPGQALSQCQLCL